MIIKVLSENTVSSKHNGSERSSIGREHGLSLYIDTGTHKILFDTGAGTLFAQNALKLGVNLAEVDMAVISHGHKDHGGGIAEFQAVNSHAPVYIHRDAFEKHLSGVPLFKVNAGLDKALQLSGRFIYTDGHFKVHDTVRLFTCSRARYPLPGGNKYLYAVKNGKTVPDEFHHEQNLLIRGKGADTLISGCAHRGIINIAEEARSLTGSYPRHIVGGLHLKGAGRAYVKTVADALLFMGADVYTCHCTGLKQFKWLKAIMGDRVTYISAGTEVKL